MANRKISELSTLNQAQFAPGDSLPIVDQSSSETKRTTIEELDLRWAQKTHTHVVSEVTGLQAELDAKAELLHNHVISDVTGLQAALDAKANQTHTHVAAEVLDFKATVQSTESSENLVSEYDDFLSTVVGNKLNFTSSVAGTGASISQNNLIFDTSVFGNLQLLTGTTTTGRAALFRSLNSHYFNGVQHSIEWKVALDSLSVFLGDRFVSYIGFGDNNGAGDMVDGVYFRYDESVSPNWLAVTSSNNLREISDTGIAVVAGVIYNKFKIEVNSLGTVANFFINGTLVATNNLNIPNSPTRACGPLIKIEKQAGNVSRNMQVDRVQIDSRRN